MDACSILMNEFNIGDNVTCTPYDKGVVGRVDDVRIINDTVVYKIVPPKSANVWSSGLCIVQSVLYQRANNK